MSRLKPRPTKTIYEIASSDMESTIAASNNPDYAGRGRRLEFGLCRGTPGNHERSPRAAARFVEEVNQVIEKILAVPQRWPRGAMDTRRVRLPCFPFTVVTNAQPLPRPRSLLDERRLEQRSFDRRGQSSPGLIEGNGFHLSGIQLRHAPGDFSVPSRRDRVVFRAIQALDQRTGQLGAFRHRQGQCFLKQLRGFFGHGCNCTPRKQ